MTINTRKTILATLLAALAATPLAVAPLQVQAQGQVQHVYTQAELDQMLAPIALYPDALLSQVLMAATYPIEVVEAARWSRANPGLQGDEAVRAVENEDWDSSVKSLVAFPQILQRMDEKLDWTRSLGDAFLAQEPQVMDQVQNLRRRAQANGNLRSDEQIRVEQQGPVIVVQPASPQYVYVPYYDPMEVYGTWWWPSYRPVAWAPWPGYVRPYHRPGISVGFWWGRPIGLSLGFFFGDFDWGRRHVRVAHNSYYYRAPVYANRSFAADRGRWQHDPQHRRGVDYRQAEVRQRFANTPAERRTVQREERRSERQATQVQAQPAARVQSQPQAVTPAQRAERRDEGRTERRADRTDDRREDRRAERQAPPAVTSAQPRTQQRDERRDDGRVERQRAQESQRQAQQAQQAQRQAQNAQRQAQQAQRQAQDAQRQAQQQAQQAAQRQAREAQRTAMPAAHAPQQPQAERQERREERREQRKDRDKS